MPLVEDDHVVETLTSNGADYPFDGIVKLRSQARSGPLDDGLERTALPISWGRIGPECLNLTVPSP